MDCREIQPAITALADGELRSDERAEVGRHLEDCPGCRASLARQRELKSLLRAKISPASTPGDLRARIAAALEGEDAHPRIAPRPLWGRLAGFWQIPRYALIAGMAVVAILAITLLPRGPSAASIPLDEVTAHFAQISTGSVNLEMRTSDISALQQFYRRTGHFTFEETAEDFSGKGLRLVGGALSHLGQRRVTMSVYEGPQGRMLCHRFHAEQIRYPEGGETLGNVRIYEVGGITVAVIRLPHNVVCILATDMPKMEFLHHVLAVA